MFGMFRTEPQGLLFRFRAQSRAVFTPAGLTEM